jgi:hypothetical protein
MLGEPYAGIGDGERVAKLDACLFRVESIEKTDRVFLNSPLVIDPAKYYYLKITPGCKYPDDDVSY